MDTKQRWLVILGAGAVVAFLAARAPLDDMPAKATLPSKAKPTVNSELAQLDLDKLKPRHFRTKTEKDIFKSKSWYVPPPSPPPPKPVKLPPPPPPPPPSAPPLPYGFMGSYQESGGKLVIYLTKAGRIYSVSPGETLEGIYQVDGINNGNFSMTYIPLNIKQTLRIR